MMDSATKTVMRALLMEFKKYMDSDNSSHLALVENAARKLDESENGVLGPAVLMALHLPDSSGMELTFKMASGKPTLWGKAIELLQTGRVITLSMEEGVKQ